MSRRTVSPSFRTEANRVKFLERYAVSLSREAENIFAVADLKAVVLEVMFWEYTGRRVFASRPVALKVTVMFPLVRFWGTVKERTKVSVEFGAMSFAAKVDEGDIGAKLEFEGTIETLGKTARAIEPPELFTRKVTETPDCPPVTFAGRAEETVALRIAGA